MSLEDALNKNTATLEKHNGLLEQLIAKADGKADAKPGKAAKGDDKAGAHTPDTVKAKVAPWLREFSAVEDDPENEARGDLLETTLKKLGDYTKVSEIKDAGHLERLDTWIGKQIKAGRIKPEHKPAAGDDQDI